MTAMQSTDIKVAQRFTKYTGREVVRIVKFHKKENSATPYEDFDRWEVPHDADLWHISTAGPDGSKENRLFLADENGRCPAKPGDPLPETVNRLRSVPDYQDELCVVTDRQHAAGELSQDQCDRLKAAIRSGAFDHLFTDKWHNWIQYAIRDFLSS